VNTARDFGHDINNLTT